MKDIKKIFEEFKIATKELTNATESFQLQNEVYKITSSGNFREVYKLTAYTNIIDLNGSADLLKFAKRYNKYVKDGHYES